ncbi:MAG: DUF4863 family protein, partial [Planctomycetes bacterium]|nr:DUF4863 family protein [Planctomycetota bacterium]
MSNETLIKELAPVLAVLKETDISDASAASRGLNARLPVNSPAMARIREMFAKGVAEKWLCDREGGGARFSRVAKASPATANFSIDAVSMSGPGVWHRHTEGEIDLCFAIS